MTVVDPAVVANGTEAAVVKLAAQQSSRPGIRAVPYSEIHRERVEWVVPGRIPLGMLTLLIGDPGLGKSLFTCMLAAQLSRGDLLGAPSPTLMLTAEDSLGATIRPRLEAAGAASRHIFAYKLLRDDGCEDAIVIPDDLDQLASLIAQTGARLIVIDPLGAHLPGTINAWQDQSVRRALAPLGRIAEETDCAVLAVLHLNKKDSSDALRRINGSTGFGAAARSVLLFASDPDDPDPENGHRRVLSHEKCNVGALASSLLFEVQPILLPATDGEPEATSARLYELGESPRRAGDLLGSGDGDHERSALDEAKDFLREELALGPRPTKDVRAAAREAGVAEETLKRARRVVCHKPKKCGFGGGWEWALRTTHEPLDSPLHEGGQVPPEHAATDPDDHLRANPVVERASAPLETPFDHEEGHISEMTFFEEIDAEIAAGVLVPTEQIGRDFG